MLWSVNGVRGYRIDAADGEIGSVVDFLFDDRTSAIRYLVVDTGSWLPGRQVLLAPGAVGQVAPETKAFPTGLTRAQVKDSPDLATDQPVSRQQEQALHAHYGWQPYWAVGPEAVGLAPYWGAAGFATPVYERQEPAGGEAAARRAAEAQQEQGDPSLRSAGEVIGYYIAARDGDIGHVEDLLVEYSAWTIRYLVIDTRNWLPGRKVLVSPQWLDRIDWPSQTVGIDLSREEISSSPEYDPAVTVDRRFEEALHQHYRRPLYW